MSDPIPTPAAAEPELERVAKAIAEIKHGHGIGEKYPDLIRAELISAAAAIASLAQPAPDATPAPRQDDVKAANSYQGMPIYTDDPGYHCPRCGLDDSGIKQALAWIGQEPTPPSRQDDDAPAQPVSAAGSEPVVWRPLSTAPQTGEVFLIASIEGTGPTLGHFADGYFRLVSDRHKVGGYGKWFWQPLPLPPVATPTPALAPQDGGTQGCGSGGYGCTEWWHAYRHYVRRHRRHRNRPRRHAHPGSGATGYYL